ncbi:MAG: lipid A deacylase LpxR family protein [Akkermansiaceae bacterium]|nr:lipid A deacylase LpxR family protein [Akkermansiaceae bacterium]
MKKSPCIIALLITATFLPGQALAQDALNSLEARDEELAIRNAMLQWDNDLFAGSDRNYTNGIRLAVGGPMGTDPDYGQIRNWLRRFSGDRTGPDFIDRLTGFDSSEIDYSWGLGFTQLMFTPEDPVPATPPPGERPYAAWTGMEISMQARDENSLSTVALTLGVTGDWAFGEEAQDFVHHNISDSPIFNGWDSQLPEEPTLNLFFNHKRRMQFLDNFQHGPLGMDGYTEFGASIGTLRTDFYVGGVMRAGWNLPGTFSSPRLQLGSYGSQYFANPANPADRFRAYLMVGAQGTLVLHDATLDGSLFRNWTHSVDSEPLVGEVMTGIGIGYGNFDLVYSQVYRSDEFRQQNSSLEYASLQLVWQMPL